MKDPIQKKTDLKHHESKIVEVVYQKSPVNETVQPMRIITGELQGTYISQAGIAIQVVMSVDEKTGDISLMNLHQANILRIQPKKMGK